MTNVAPRHGGIERDPATLASHRMKGGQLDMLRSCLTLTLRLKRTPAMAEVAAALVACDVGHRVPTGFVDRNLVLCVEAFDQNGRSINVPPNNPVLPTHTGKEFVGRAGKLYAKQLQDFGGSRPVPFWRARTDLEDSRLIPDQTDRFEVRFPGDAVRSRVRLIYRRFWPAVAEAKGWPNDDIIVWDQTLLFPAASAGDALWSSLGGAQLLERAQNSCANFRRNLSAFDRRSPHTGNLGDLFGNVAGDP
jgi:hypothetical protein